MTYRHETNDPTPRQVFRGWSIVIFGGLPLALMMGAALMTVPDAIVRSNTVRLDSQEAFSSIRGNASRASLMAEAGR